MRQPDPESFFPLPGYPWLERPLSSPLDVEEAATALYLKHGNISAAAARLKVSVPRLMKTVRKSPRLLRLQAQLSASAPVSDAESTPATGSQSEQTTAPAPQP